MDFFGVEIPLDDTRFVFRFESDDKDDDDIECERPILIPSLCV